MDTISELLGKKIDRLKQEQPQMLGFLESYGIRPENGNQQLGQYLDMLTDDFFEDIGIGKDQLMNNFQGFVHNMSNASVSQQTHRVESVTIIGGFDKDRVQEDIRLTLKAGTITCIVGPTGSGKSRLLADIEWMAQGDTPTGRKILVNNAIPDYNLRFSLEHKLVAQLSQNMNFVMDTTVAGFIKMHAESRLVKDADNVAADIIAQANLLAGENFSVHTPVTSLSGGQSRALMIADTAFLSLSPVVLIDEIENAGIDRKKALQLLIKKEKIVLMATHDPVLALMGSQRLVIKNGGIRKIIQTTEKEKQNLTELEAIDSRMHTLRNRLRNGECIDEIG
jgi:ABC-type lipoprotein export system ATPase subunit